MAEKISVLLSEEEVDKRIQEIGEQISKDYAGEQVHLVCVLRGGVFFLCELAKRITVPVSLDFMSVSSYGSDTKSSVVVKIVKDLDDSLAPGHPDSGGNPRPQRQAHPPGSGRVQVQDLSFCPDPAEPG